MRYFPIFVDLAERDALVAGVGEAALQKTRLALKSDARVRVVGADPHADLVELARAARARSIPVNVVDTPELNDFITPAIVDRDPVTVAIDTEGTAPVLARIEALLPLHLGRVAEQAAALRGQVARLFAAGAAPRAAWSELFERGWRGGKRALEAAAADLPGALDDDETGCVWLVGAGPGDPELMTLKARHILDSADVVVYDRLVDQRILELARREARFIAVGKTPGERSITQAEINEILTSQASAGYRVVRLKGGDPLVFGRADEEIEALLTVSIEVQIVPGITAASAAAAAGVSLIRRQRNQSVALITARDANGPAEHDWRSLAADGAAFAVYMGVGQARFIQGRMLLHGARAETPVTVVENARREDECIVAGTLATLSSLIKSNGITGPAVLLVGLLPAKTVSTATALNSRGAA